MATASALRLPFFPMTATPEPPQFRPRIERRKTTPRQGVALEVLGHAIEYLADARLCEGGPTQADMQAMRILMVCSRDVFAESRAIIPVHQRLGSWVHERLRKRLA